MLCIICLQEKPPSDEHVIPIAIGGSLVIDRVCKECNDFLGRTTDAGLIKHYEMQKRRVEHGLEGQSGSVPDPLKAALKSPVVAIEDPNQKLLLRPKKTGEGFDAKIIPIVEFEVQVFPGNLLRVECKKCYIDPTETPENVKKIVKNALRKAGVTGTKPLEEAANRFIAELTPHEDHVTAESLVKVNMGGHQLGVLKVAYEMAWYWLGDSWLDDPQAVTMRSALRGEAPPMQAAVFEPGRFFLLGYDNRKTHLVFIFPGMGKLLLVVRLLDVFAVGFVATDSPGKYGLPSDNALVMNVATRSFELRPLDEIVGGITS